MRASWGAVPKWLAEPLLPEVHGLIEADPDAKAKALELFRGRGKTYLDRTVVRS